MLYTQIQKDIPPIFDAVGCICKSKNKILLLKRAGSKSYPYYWGVPSGKMEKTETPLRAMIRELYEETGLLLSSENLEFFRTYHVVNETMSFMYTLYISQFDEQVPAIKLNHKEHVRFVWTVPEDALKLKLVPDLDRCLKDSLSTLRYPPKQLYLFPELEFGEHCVAELEESVIKEVSILSNYTNLNQSKVWYASFGPPCVGKTTAFRSLANRNNSFDLVQNTSILKKTTRIHFYLEKIFQEDEHLFFFHFQLEALTMRFQQSFTAPNNSLVDETIYCTLAYSRALYHLKWLKDYEYQTFYNHYIHYEQMLPIPTAIYYFYCKPSTIIKRLEQRLLKQKSRHHEKYYSENYINALCYAFSDIATELSKKQNVIYIDTDKINQNEIIKLYVSNNTN